MNLYCLSSVKKLILTFPDVALSMYDKRDSVVIVLRIIIFAGGLITVRPFFVYNLFFLDFVKNFNTSISFPTSSKKKQLNRKLYIGCDI